MFNRHLRACFRLHYYNGTRVSFQHIFRSHFFILLSLFHKIDENEIINIFILEIRYLNIYKEMEWYLKFNRFIEYIHWLTYIQTNKNRSKIALVAYRELVRRILFTTLSKFDKNDKVHLGIFCWWKSFDIIYIIILLFL